MSKLRLAVIFGGTNSEHEVSLLSAASVIKNLSREKYIIYPIAITKEGRWLYFTGSLDELDEIDLEHPSFVPAIISPDRTVKGMVISEGESGSYNQTIDVAFPVLHGRYGEDGTIQGLFALAGIPYVGADVLSSAVCMDKEIANRLFEHAKIAHADWDVMHDYEMELLDDKIMEWEKSLGYPMFVKPANAGSSVGVGKAPDVASLKAAVKVAFLHDSKLIVEKAIVGNEIECAVLGNNQPEASVLSEIIPLNEFYDYDAKYITPSKTELPADIEPEIADEIRSIAKKAYLEVGCSGMARVDFLYESATKTIFLNEINTIPGFTSISMYARMMDASGVPYNILLDRLIEYALEKAQREVG